MEKDKLLQPTFYPPVVTVLGHVDHGKTSLLDAIRKTNIALREQGGITQKIGASEIEVVHENKKRTITFIDTPGHLAFSQMRSRGASVADIGLLIVSLVDGVMPQTKESIRLFKEVKLPFVVVLTKADVEGSIPEKVKQQLLREEVMLEGYGGDVPVIEVSSKTGKNIRELLDLILLLWELKPPSQPRSLENPLEAIVIESKLDTKAGPKASVVIKNGSLRLRDELVCEGRAARARTLFTDTGQVTQAGIGEAVEILGFEAVPPVGSIVRKKGEAEKVSPLSAPLAHTIAPLEHPLPAQVPGALPFLPTEKEKGLLSLILAADTLGSLEAITSALPHENLYLITQKTGEVSEADVLLAKSTGSIILSFNTKLRNQVVRLASTEKVLLRNYAVIYELLDEVKDVLEGKQLALEEKIYGQAQVLASFPFEKTKVLGVKVIDGRVAKGDRVRLMRGENTIGESMITSVRQGKSPASKVERGQEAGIIITPLLDFTVGDMVICHG